MGISVLLAGLSLELCSSLRSISAQLTDIHSVTRVHSLEGAVEVCKSNPPDVLLLEVPLQAEHQRDHIRGLLRLTPHPAMVALSRLQDDESLFQAIGIGATAFLPYDTPPEFIISTVRRVYSGEQPIEYTMVANVGLARQVLRDTREPGISYSTETAHCPLTQRELGILSSVASGHSNKEIASELVVREQTVKNSISAILRKIDANDRVQAVTLALRNRWMPLN